MDDIGHEDKAECAGGMARFSALMEEVRQGSQDAAAQVWRQYGPYVVYVVRRSLHQRMRSQLDSQDFSQAVWASFFANLPDASELDSPGDLVRFLSTMARNKVVEEHRRLHGRRRNLKRHRLRGQFLEKADCIDERMPTPSQEIAAEELAEQLTADQPDQFRRIVRMRRDGLTAEEIARREETTPRSVRRVLSHLRRVFRRKWRDRHE